VKSCLPMYLIDNECMHVALCALLCSVKQGSRAAEQSRAEQIACSCKVLCCAKVRGTTEQAVRPCQWQDRNIYDPVISRIVTYTSCITIK
jgi:hypothetical protein